MRASGVFVLMCIAAFVSRTMSSDGPCEKFENIELGSIGALKTCFMHSTVINSKDFSITSDRDETVEGFYVNGNKKFEYVPNNLGAKFSNLAVLAAEECFIKEISKKNFKGLGKLRKLYLPGNQIEKIDDDTFDHIPAVEGIRLLRNKIKKLNGLAFASLHKLTHVWLNGNECISEDFLAPETIAEMSRAVNEKCGFIDSTKIAKLEADLIEQSEEMQALKLENAKLRIEKAQAELQTATVIEFHNEIKAQLKETCNARIELKTQEIFHCSNDLQAKTAEINEKNEKIKQCEKKNRILGGALVVD